MTGNKKAELKVAGMVCAACTQAIEKALRSLDGVAFASVNLGTETASVEYDSEKLRLADLEKAIRDVGYDVIDEKVVLENRRHGLRHVRRCTGNSPQKIGWGGGGASESGFGKSLCHIQSQHGWPRRI